MGPLPLRINNTITNINCERSIAKTKILSRQFFHLYYKNSLFYGNKFLSRIFCKFCEATVHDCDFHLYLKIFPYCKKRCFSKLQNSVLKNIRKSTAAKVTFLDSSLYNYYFLVKFTTFRILNYFDINLYQHLKFSFSLDKKCRLMRCELRKRTDKCQRWWGQKYVKNNYVTIKCCHS